MLKIDIRKMYKSKRASLSDEERHHLSYKIAKNVYANIFIEGKTCSIFLPIKSQKEVDTFCLIDLYGQGKVTFVVSKSDFSTGEMHHYKYENQEQLAINKWGIPEPQYGEFINSNEIDIVFVPLLAIDKSGHRVGYGKGFYDRFLETCPSSCKFIGLHIFDELAEIDDLNSHDIPLHSCVTPNKIYHFEKSTSR